MVKVRRYPSSPNDKANTKCNDKFRNLSSIEYSSIVVSPLAGSAGSWVLTLRHSLFDRRVGHYSGYNGSSIAHFHSDPDFL
jgi:hypothetical protein